MARYRMGLVIKMMREARGMTQKQLVEGICSERSLLRFENEQQKMTKEICKKLMERLGMVVDLEYQFAELEVENFELLDMKRMLDDHLHFFRFEKANLLWAELDDKLDKDSRINRQYLTMTKAIIEYYQKYIKAERYLEKLKEALYETLPFYDEVDRSKIPYHRLEVQIVLDMAYGNSELGELNLALELCENLENVLQYHYIYGDLYNRAYLNVLRAKGKYVGSLGYYEKAIEIFERGIKTCINAKEGNLLGSFFYGIAWDKEKLHKNKPEPEDNKNEVISILKKAYYLSKAVNDKFTADFIRKQYYQHKH